MKKLFNNSTKRARIETQAVEQTETQTTRKSKRKALRGFAFGGVALMMATAGVFAFAPLGNVAPASLEASQPTDVLVTPQEDDPVLFTTEDGLEIKWGNAASLQGGGKETWSGSFTTYASAQSGIGSSAATNRVTHNLTSGNLKGFPYFTTTSGSTTYTWVIIGRNSNVTNNALYSAMKVANISSSKSSAKIEYKTLNDWKAKIGNSDTYDNFVAGYSPTYKSFFNNTYETTSPAGAAINNNGLLSAVTARNYSASASWSYSDSYMNVSSVKTSTEIPSGCVLVLANGNVATGSASEKLSGYNEWHAGFQSACPMYKAMQGYHTNGSFGLSAIKSRIQQINLTTYSFTYYGTWNWDTLKINAYIFPLGCNTSSTFYYANYLTAAQIKLSATQWLRGTSNGTYHQATYLNTSGNQAHVTLGNNTPIHGYRPAFVLKVT